MKSIKSPLSVFLTASVSFAIAACGTTPAGQGGGGVLGMPGNGGGIGGAGGNTGQTAKCDAAFDRTGTLRSDGAFTSMVINNSVIAGDEGNTNLAQRGFVSIVLRQIPAGANISKVILKLRASAPEGNPLVDFGPLTVDHVNVVSGINAGSFLGSTLTANIATISTLPSGLRKQVIELDVTAHVKADIAAGRPISSFRFQFANAPSADGSFDQVFMDADQNDETLRPTATVTIAS